MPLSCTSRAFSAGQNQCRCCRNHRLHFAKFLVRTIVVVFSAVCRWLAWPHACSGSHQCRQAIVVLSLHGPGQWELALVLREWKLHQRRISETYSHFCTFPEQRSSVKWNYSSNITVVKCRWSRGPCRGFGTRLRQQPHDCIIELLELTERACFQAEIEVALC